MKSHSKKNVNIAGPASPQDLYHTPPTPLILPQPHLSNLLQNKKFKKKHSKERKGKMKKEGNMLKHV